MLRSFDAAMMEYKGYLGTVHAAGSDLYLYRCRQDVDEPERPLRRQE